MAEAHTSDQQPRSNMLTRQEWLKAIIYSNGEVTRIAQHLALVIYHLSDEFTNVATMSARDLERITGWGRTAIIHHLGEIENFVRVRWGAGRAKSTFELQCIITQTLAEQKAREAATRVDTAVDATPVASATQEDATSSGHVADTTADTKVCGHDVDAMADTTVDTTGYVHVADTKQRSCVHVADTNSQNANEGGTIGGESRLTVINPNKHTHTIPTDGAAGYATQRGAADAAPPVWGIAEDGGFEGLVFELSPAEYEGLQQIYTYLEWPADLVAADQFFGREFDRKGGDRPRRVVALAGLHTYLAKHNRKVRELRMQMGILTASKGPRKGKPAHPELSTEPPPSCWFDDDARLQVANGFKVELLEAVGGDEIRLRKTLDQVSGIVGVNTRGPQLMAKVRSRMIQFSGGGGSAKADMEERNARRERKFAETRARLEAKNNRGHTS